MALQRWLASIAGQLGAELSVVDSMALFEEKWEALQTGSHFGSSLRPEHRVEHECLFVPNLIPNDCELLILLASH